MFFPVNISLALLTKKVDHPFFFAAIYTALSVIWGAAFDLASGVTLAIILKILFWGVFTFAFSSAWFFLLTAAGDPYYWVILLLGIWI